MKLVNYWLLENTHYHHEFSANRMPQIFMVDQNCPCKKCHVGGHYWHITMMYMHTYVHKIISSISIILLFEWP